MSLKPGRTQDHLEIVDVKQDALILEGGRFRMVLETTSTNFDLLSEAEQDAAIYSYANLINSLDFPLQVVVRTRQIDIENYLSYLDTFHNAQPTDALRQQLDSYIRFVRELVAENTVLYKKFYVVVPFNVSSQETTKGLFSSLPSFSQKKKQNTTTYSEEIFQKAQETFARREQELAWQFRRLGIRIRRLSTEELIRLFYEIYNPENGENPGLKSDIRGYTALTVAPNVA